MTVVTCRISRRWILGVTLVFALSSRIIADLKPTSVEVDRSTPVLRLEKGDRVELTEVFAPFGLRMPPDVIEVGTCIVGRYKYMDCHDYTGRYLAVRSKVRGVTQLSPFKFDYSHSENDQLLPHNAMIHSAQDVEDGALIPLGGQLYRWGDHDRKLSRQPNHPLSTQPSDTLGIFHLPIGGLMEISLQDGGKLDLEPLAVVRAMKTDSEPDRVLLRIGVTNVGNHSGLYGPSPLPISTEELYVPPHQWVRVGQYIESSHWRVKLVRVVHPNAQIKIVGWIDVRVEASSIATLRPPAPYLPED